MLIRFGRSGETCSKRSARNSEPCEFTHLGERQSRFREFSAVGMGRMPQGTPTSLVVYAHLFMLRITTPLRCFTPKQMAMAKTKVRLKCKRLSGLFVLVGVARLELAASWSRTKRATKLRYTPFSVLAD